MTRAAVATWAVALLFAALISIWVVHSHRLRDRACVRGASPSGCIQAKKTEDGAILMGVLGSVFLVMVGGIVVASARRRA